MLLLKQPRWVAVMWTERGRNLPLMWPGWSDGSILLRDVLATYNWKVKVQRLQQCRAGQDVGTGLKCLIPDQTAML